jgi:hypothetical protein
LQRGQQWVQPWLLDLRDAVRLVLLSGDQHPAGIPRQLTLVIAEVKPAIVPAAVRGDQLCRDVLVTTTRPDLQHAAPRAHRAPRPSFLCFLGEELRPEEMEPQVPLRIHPQVPLTDHRENGGL